MQEGGCESRKGESNGMEGSVKRYFMDRASKQNEDKGSKRKGPQAPLLCEFGGRTSGSSRTAALF